MTNTEELDNIADTEYDFELLEEQSDLVQKIKKGIEKLPEGYRVVLSLYLLEGYDHVEIAQVLNISESTSKSQFLRAKDKLRKVLINEL
jgi:RNA polymerase sigma-70 factor (ECF subfamily)